MVIRSAGEASGVSETSFSGALGSIEDNPAAVNVGLFLCWSSCNISAISAIWCFSGSPPAGRVVLEPSEGGLLSIEFSVFLSGLQISCARVLSSNCWSGKDVGLFALDMLVDLRRSNTLSFLLKGLNLRVLRVNVGQGSGRGTKVRRNYFIFCRKRQSESKEDNMRISEYSENIRGPFDLD